MVYVLYAIAALAALLVLLVLVASFRPDDFIVERSILVKAPANQLFPYINNLKRFQEWNPYKEKDLKAKNEFSGPDEGPGAVFRWSGDGNVGEGSMTISKTTPDSKVFVDLKFTRPFACQNQVEFGLAPATEGTVVTWHMAGKNTLVAKIMCLFMNMDKMVGGDFEYGLKRLKSLVETGSP